MSEVVYYVAASLDGFIATADGSVEWLAPFEAAETDYGYAEFYAGLDAVVMGSRTYEQVLGFGGTPYADKRVLVLSSRDLPSAGGIEVAAREPAEAIDRLASEGARRIWLVGGGETAGAFARAGLIDTYIVSVMPVLLGAGVPLLGREGAEGRLTLERTERFDDVVQCTYVAAREP